MEQLNTQRAMKLLEDTQKAQPHGLTTTGGKTITAQPLIDATKGLGYVKSAAMLIRSLMLLSKPKKCYLNNFKEQDGMTFREYEWKSADTTPDEKTIIENSLLPADKGRIIDYLSRYLSIAKDMNMAENKKILRFKDDADVLFGLPEYSLVLGIVDLIEQEKSNFYPPVSIIKEKCECHFITHINGRSGWDRI